MKKIILLFFTTFLILFSFGCGTKKKIAEEVAKNSSYVGRVDDEFPRVISKYGDGYAIDGGELLMQSVMSYSLAGYDFYNNVPRPLYFYYEGKLYSLIEAYSLGLLVNDDIKDISLKFKEKNTYQVFKNTKEKNRHLHTGNWNIIQEATTENAGYKELKCEICDVIYKTEEIEKLHHKHNDENCKICNYTYKVTFPEDVEKSLVSLDGPIQKYYGNYMVNTDGVLQTYDILRVKQSGYIDKGTIDIQKIGNYYFKNPYGCEIYVYRLQRKYTLKQAFEKGMICDSILKEIALKDLDTDFAITDTKFAEEFLKFKEETIEYIKNRNLPFKFIYNFNFYNIDDIWIIFGGGSQIYFDDYNNNNSEYKTSASIENFTFTNSVPVLYVNDSYIFIDEAYEQNLITINYVEKVYNHLNK